MIFVFEPDNIPDIPAFRVCRDFIKSYSPEKVAMGKFYLPDGIYCAVSEAVPAVGNDFFFEAHKRFADLHYIISGEQTMWVSPASKMNILGTNEEKDLIRLEGKAEAVLRMTPGSALIVYPEDAHTLAKEQPSAGQVKKIIFKIPMNLLQQDQREETNAPLS